MQSIIVPGLSYDHRAKPVINHEVVAHTQIELDPDVCPVCGNETMVTHTLSRWDNAEKRYVTGSMKKCSECDREHWLFTSHMPRAVAARKLYEEKYKI